MWNVLNLRLSRKTIFCAGKLSCLVVFYLFLTSQVQAEYILPYPSFMPGSKVYKLSRYIDEIKRYWYWGNIASFKYYLGQSDKALIEAKTLFDYRQYLLAVQALHRSDKAFAKVNDYNHKVIAEYYSKRYQQLLEEASNEHVRMLTAIKRNVPERYVWNDEKASPSLLTIHSDIDDSIRQRLAVQINR